MKASMGEMIGQRLMLAFQGKEQLSAEIRKAIKQFRPGGMTLFRSHNIDDPPQVKHLTDLLQSAAREARLPPLLIAADQEGGQLMAVGNGTTLLPGNMALGATGSTDLSRRAGEVLGRELAAMGINVNYAPCCDVNSNPDNPVIGIRSFGENPAAVAELASAMVTGIQSAGVAASAKHFPGHGDTTSDSHAELPVVSHALLRLRAVEFPPFESAIRAGTKMVMTAHLALPAIDGLDASPATLSSAVLKGLLRNQLGFQGVIITDAMDMHAITQGNALGANAVRAAASGADLLLMTTDPNDQDLVHTNLLRAAKDGTLAAQDLTDSAERISSLKRWLANRETKYGLDVVGCSDHRRVADEIASRSITLVRDHAKILPLCLASGQRAAVIVPRPVDLTPADTSSYESPALASAFRKYHPETDEYSVSHAPTQQEIAGVLDRISNYSLVVIGTLNAFSERRQQELVHQILLRNIPTIVIAMRLPYDLMSFPGAPTYVCTYSLLEPSMGAVASALFGRGKFQGRLPVSIPHLYPAGYPSDL
ncbi:MAG TPA: glycoside hydrolase family 3 N-terminal domain-containing protein [Anaerolineales bacterium]|nr:glycoside hydrolase family 3 N-terminal domain-containing protein [Anaerolineales bacterium]